MLACCSFIDRVKLGPTFTHYYATPQDLSQQGGQTGVTYQAQQCCMKLPDLLCLLAKRESVCA